MKDRFFLAQDNDCHWYVVPEIRKEEWESWVNLDDDASCEPPEWTLRTYGPPSAVTFEAPMIEIS